MLHCATCNKKLDLSKGNVKQYCSIECAYESLKTTTNNKLAVYKMVVTSLYDIVTEAFNKIQDSSIAAGDLKVYLQETDAELSKLQELNKLLII